MDAQGSVTYGGQSRITALRRAPPRAAPLRRPPPPRALPGNLDLPVSGDGAGRRNPAVSSPKGLPVSDASGDGTRGPRGRRAFIKAARVADRRSPSAFSICRMSAAPRRLVASRVFVCLRRLSCMVPSLHVAALAGCGKTLLSTQGRKLSDDKRRPIACSERIIRIGLSHAECRRDS